MICQSFRKKNREKKMNGLQTYPGKKIRYLWSDTQKSVIMELLAACYNRDAGSINFCFTPYAASHTFA